MTPKISNQNPQAKPASADAQRVSETIPLFCERVVLGGVVPRAR